MAEGERRVHIEAVMLAERAEKASNGLVDVHGLGTFWWLPAFPGEASVTLVLRVRDSRLFPYQESERIAFSIADQQGRVAEGHAIVVFDANESQVIVPMPLPIPVRGEVNVREWPEFEPWFMARAATVCRLVGPPGVDLGKRTSLRWRMRDLVRGAA